MYALYARQSVDNKESISIESQLDLCRQKAVGHNFVEYKDKGFSGKNTERPAFQKMMEDLRKQALRFGAESCSLKAALQRNN